MRILAVNSDRGIAPDGTKGASVHLRSLLGAFSAIGHDVHLLTRRSPEDSNSLTFSIERFEDTEELLQAARRLKPDFVYERYALNSRSGLTAAESTEVPYVLEVNAPLFREASTHRPDTIHPDSHAIEQELWQKADLVLPVSTQLARTVKEVRGTNLGVHVIKNGVNSALFETPRPPAPPATPTRIAFLGHPKPWHGITLLAEALHSLTSEGRACVLTVIGGGPGAGELMTKLEELGLGDSLRITGPLAQEDAIRVLTQNDISVAPYDCDSDDFYFCPLKVVESLAARVPIVTTDVGDIGPIIGDCGELVAGRNPREFAASIARVIDDWPAAMSRAEEGRRRALTHYTWERNAAAITELLAEASADGDAT